MSDHMSEELSILVELQRKDTEIRKLTDSRQALPAALKTEEDELAREEARLREKEEELGTVSKRRKNKETDLEDIAEKIKRLERQLLKVATNKEYEATLTEINNLRALHSTAEGDLMKFMEQEEDLSENLRSLQEEFGPRVKRVEEHKRSVELELEHNERLIPAARKHREETAERLSQATRARYERIAKGKNGVAVVAVAKGACGGCFTALPAQRINEIKTNDRIIQCEHCGRILVWDEKVVPEGGQG